jgi:hypothetical protein
MNCVYEWKSVELMNRISFSPQMFDDVLASDFSKRSWNPCIELNLSLMILYPTDCLSIGYFARHACELIQRSTYCGLNLSCCMLKDKEIKALSQELCKPIQNRNLFLNLGANFLTEQALQSIRAVLMSGSGVCGLSVSGSQLEDVQLALKYFIEGLNPSPLLVLCITYIRLPVPIAHHLVLLLHSGQYLSTLILIGNVEIFTNPRIWLLFCESLKYSTSLTWLVLDSCGINNLQLQLLAAAITGGSRLRNLEINCNRYTAAGLTQFLQTLVNRVYRTHLIMLSADKVLAEHHSLVEEFNLKRNPFTQQKLSIGGRIRQSEKGANSMLYLLSDPKHYARDYRPKQKI